MRLMLEGGMFLYPRSPAYRDWTTAQLQQRRIDLYNMVPQSQSRNGVASTSTMGCRYPSKTTYAWSSMNCLAVIKLEIKQRN